jgi:hypothetical protein
MRRVTDWLTAAALVIGPTRCTDDSSSAAASRLCIPNETRICSGPGSCAGAQTCDGTGQAWTACDCGERADGGSPPDGATEPDAAGDNDRPPPNIVLIDDMEGSQNGPLRLSPGAGTAPGYWWATISSGTTSNSLEPNPFVYEALPSPHPTMDGVTSQKAAHLRCTIGDQYGFCNVGLWFAQLEPGTAPTDGAVYHLGIAATGNPDARIPYDLSAHTGIVFWGMAQKPTELKVAISDADTDPIAGRCGQTVTPGDQCWDSFSSRVTLTETWQRFEVTFDSLRQEGWGYRAPSGAFDPPTAYNLAFQVNGPASAGAEPVVTEFWIDDLCLE